MTVTLASGAGYREVDACTWAHPVSTARRVHPLEHRLGYVASMKLGSDTHLIALK